MHTPSRIEIDIIQKKSADKLLSEHLVLRNTSPKGINEECDIDNLATKLSTCVEPVGVGVSGDFCRLVLVDTYSEKIISDALLCPGVVVITQWGDACKAIKDRYPDTVCHLVSPRIFTELLRSARYLGFYWTLLEKLKRNTS
jgi:hypothetical protein